MPINIIHSYLNNSKALYIAILFKCNCSKLSGRLIGGVITILAILKITSIQCGIGFQWINEICR